MNTLDTAKMGERAMKKMPFVLRFASRVAVATLACVFFAIPGAPAAHAQGKSTDMSKVVRLSRAPVNKEVLRVKLPTPTTVKLPNGLTIIMLEDHKLPTIAFTMWIRPGQLADPADIPGLASFTADMLNEGAAHRSSEQIAKEVDSLGASLSATSRFGASYTSVNASGLINDAPQILDLMGDIVLHPAFPVDELAKYKERQGADLEERLSNPAFLAQQAFRRVLYNGEGNLAVNSATKEAIAKGNAGRPEEFSRQILRAGQRDPGRQRRLQVSRHARADRKAVRRMVRRIDASDTGASTARRAGSQDHVG